MSHEHRLTRSSCAETEHRQLRESVARLHTASLLACRLVEQWTGYAKQKIEYLKTLPNH